MYTEKVMEHFNNPRNVGIIADPTVLVQVGEPSCGDALLLSLKIDNDRIVDVKYKIYGCGAAIATASVASEMVMGLALDDVLNNITDQTIADALDGLPPEKMHCSNMAAGALHGAICEYRKTIAAKHPVPAN
ncbi:iron-sulfur cluster assembly scaffold protein [Pelovirga terrestris]|uniref:Iron-sulfur cluster assembly scaffold protein n=1 Tax=Pelovirga terrestris TaxID=2771352 RepID=A0A8J6QXJ6_9BACT|nr:iron-sulfur cluster assembly scaffold protein [Pelovirga terrestris]MBD1400776.1 iron-sulfur cluster assembly scaffold protein [Pelovirga terrestris]